MSYIGNTSTQQDFTPAVDFFNGNGSTTAFTLSRPVASVAQVQAVISNVPQKPGDAFTVSGNTITFTSAPPSGTSNIYVYYTSPITQVIAPGQGTVTTTALQDGSVTTAKIADNAITTAKIAAGAVIPADLSTGAPSWDTSGNVTLTGPTQNITGGTGSSGSPSYTSINFKGYLGNRTAVVRSSDQSSSTLEAGQLQLLVNANMAADSPSIVATVNSYGILGLKGSAATNQSTGTGIAFPATQSASSDANTLDDYEEGTWTASYGASGSDTGTYTKIGNVVVTRVVLTSAGQTFNTITGCPFTPNGYTPASKSRGNGCSVDINTISIGGTSDLIVTNSSGTAVNITTSGTVRLDIQRTFII